MKLDYELLDSGNRQKWERFGNNSIVRPEAQATWQPKNAHWIPDAFIEKQLRNQFHWQKNNTWQEPWRICYSLLQFELRLSQSKNIGIFPEQEENWRWMSAILRKYPGANVPNLFAYTGAATLVATKEGANVCHVDSSKSTVKWASLNASLNHMDKKSIRWIVDDALAFLNREKRRDHLYDGIILDPPPMGHGKKGIFTFKKQVRDLLQLSKQILIPNPLFVIFNCYALNLTPREVKPIVLEFFPDQKLESSELFVKETNRKKRISCSVFIRFS